MSDKTRRTRSVTVCWRIERSNRSTFTTSRSVWRRGGQGIGSKWFLSNARHLIREQGCRQIVGTIISIARKGALPLVEKHDGLL
nr:transporter substrate-binding protein [uncultured Agrobacterium sp.]